MTLEVRQSGGKGNRVVMTRCSLCGHRFRPREKRSRHFLNEHTVDDVPALARGGRDAY